MAGGMRGDMSADMTAEKPGETVRLAAIQMVSTPRVNDNLKVAGELIRQAVDGGAQMVALPEYFPLIGASDAQRLAAREPLGEGPIQQWMADLAREYGLWLFGGSIPLYADQADKLRNTTLVFDPQGNRVARYDKVHLFAFQQGSESYREADTIEAGKAQAVVVHTPWARVGLSICYDLRFPELYRAMVRAGEAPDLILVPAAFTETTGQAHWEILLRARAIENQCYVLAIGQGGVHENGRCTHGNSMLIDPWGTVISRLDKGAGVLLGEFCPQRIAVVRESLPALLHHHLQEF